MAQVDYDRTATARRYARGRSLSTSVLDRWRAAVVPLLPGRSRHRVLDVGAGTGIFARAWPTWTPCAVVALEPSAPMRIELCRGPLPSQVRVVAGSAESVPLAAASVDAVWLSAVVHHLTDLDVCAAEIGRVLAADGVVAVRGLFADLGTTPGLELFPGASRVTARFPRVGTLAGSFERHGLQVVATTTVEDAGPPTVAALAERVRSLRGADTLLAQLTDDEIEVGLGALEAMDPGEAVPPARLGLLAVRRHGGSSAPRA